MKIIKVKNTRQAIAFAIEFPPTEPCIFTRVGGQRLAVWLINSAGFGELYTNKSMRKSGNAWTVKARALFSCLSWKEFRK